MKKFVKLLIISIMIIASVCSFAACSNDADKSGEAGIVCKKLTGDDFYTVIGYGAEKDAENKDVTTLDISAAAKTKYGETAVVGRIRTGAFDGNTTLKEVIVTDSVEGVELTIDEGAFKNMRALEKITLPFVGASRISDADINETAPALGDAKKATDKERSFGYIFGEEENGASSKITLTYGDVSGQTADFYIPAALTEITINASKEINIPMYAFCGLTRVETVLLSGNVKAIGRAAFKNMDKLSKISVPKSVKVIYDEAFVGTSKLKVFGENGLSFEEGSLLTEIKSGAFKETSLTSFDISGTQVKVIGDNAFYNSALRTFTFSATIEKVGAYAFANSKDLAVEPPACETGINAFADVKEIL